jgi:dolichol-phosphate mannosyltransferase
MTDSDRLRRTSVSLVSLVIPVFNEREVLPLLRPRLEAMARALPCAAEWILVNDGSRDGSGEALRAWAREDDRAKLIELSRNFGHQAAITAGLDHARGDAVVVMDADLQDPPELVPEMVARYLEGFDVVHAQRSRRDGETAFKRATATAFYWLMRRFVHRSLPADTGDFRLLSREAARALAGLREGQRFLRGMVAWVGFEQTVIRFERPRRAAGQTKFPLARMMAFAKDAIISFSSAPLRFSTYLGLAVFLFGIGYAFYAAYQALVLHVTVPGWTSLVILQNLIGGAALFCIGMVGEYVGRIYEEIKQRPIYVVRRTVNLEPPPQLPERSR